MRACECNCNPTKKYNTQTNQNTKRNKLSLAKNQSFIQPPSHSRTSKIKQIFIPPNQTSKKNPSKNKQEKKTTIHSPTPKQKNKRNKQQKQLKTRQNKKNETPTIHPFPTYKYIAKEKQAKRTSKKN